MFVLAEGGNGEKPAWVSRVESSRPSAINTQSSRAAGDTRDSSVESSLDATPLTADSSDAFVASSGSTDTLVAPSPTAAPAYERCFLLHFIYRLPCLVL